jgi:chromosome segregation ATPase
MVEKMSDDLISCWENAKELISQYDRTNKDLDKQLQATKKQLVVLEDKASKKTRQLEDTSRYLKWKKERTKTPGHNSKGLEVETDRKMKKVEGERDLRIKQLETDWDKWKEKANKLTSNLQVLKSSVLEKKLQLLTSLSSIKRR